MRKYLWFFATITLLITTIAYKPTRKMISKHFVGNIMKVYFPMSGCPSTPFTGARDRLFSQGYEDYILSNVFEGTDHGFYVDVGANNPNQSNVTLYFYKKGWRGMNFEPQPWFHEIFVKDRVGDINIQKAVSDNPGTATFYVPSPLSPVATLDSKIKTIEFSADSREITVEVTTLTKEFTDYNIKDIDFLKIDVEGFEGKVVNGLDLQKFRPKVIMLEYISPAKNNGYLEFEPKILENGYILALDDGLNRYYYRQENHELEAKFNRIGRCVKIDRMSRGLIY